MTDTIKPTQISEALAVEMAQLFGGQDQVPAELKTAWYMIHARLMECEQDIEYFWKRVARYRAEPPTASETNVAGEETGEF